MPGKLEELHLFDTRVTDTGVEYMNVATKIGREQWNWPAFNP
jgi:hypothetical protein